MNVPLIPTIKSKAVSEDAFRYVFPTPMPTLPTEPAYQPQHVLHLQPPILAMTAQVYALKVHHEVIQLAQ